MEIVNAIIDIDSADRIDYLGNYVSKKIRENCEKSAKVLFEYPVVYVHTYIGVDDHLHFYVGETIDLVRRTDEHDESAQDYTEWQTNWINGRDRKSFYFSSVDFNKSFILDIEDSLIKVFKRVAKNPIQLDNKKENAQKSYNNKFYRNDALQTIWNILREIYNDLPPMNKDLINKCELSDGKSKNDFETAKDWIIKGPFKFQGIERIQYENDEEKFILQNFPVVYMHIWKEENKGMCVYTGEAIDLISRTNQHLKNEEKTDWRTRWNNASEKWMMIVGGKEFNTSLTRDLENRLIQYTIFLGKTQNGRTNDQRSYDISKQLYPLFCGVVEQLNRFDPEFCSLKEVETKSILMASPLLKLTEEQEKVKTDINNEILDKLENKNSNKNQLIVVSGSAGTGKTVLLSSLFFGLLEKPYTSYFVVNHKELCGAYRSQEQTWNLSRDKKYKNRIWIAQKLINQIKQKGMEKPDILFVDEGHLLYTKNEQGKHPDPQLEELVKLAKVTVLMFDPRQFVSESQSWEFDYTKDTKEQVEGIVKDADVSVYSLETQMRMGCAESTANWIKSVASEGKIIKLDGCTVPKVYALQDTSKAYVVKDSKGYEIGIFETCEGLRQIIEALQRNPETCPSRILSTYDSPYGKNGGIPFEENPDLHWHNTGSSHAMENRIWTVESPINEVGSIHDVQGFDLNYAGVLLRDSYGFKKGEIIFKRTKRRGVPKYGDPQKAHSLMENENWVLLSRGIKGLYIYANDEKLRKALMESMS